MWVYCIELLPLQDYWGNHNPVDFYGIQYALTHTGTNSYKHVYTKSWQVWRVCFYLGLTEAVGLRGESGWNTAGVEDGWPFACVSFRKYPKPSDMCFDVSQSVCVRERKTRESFLQQLPQLHCCKREGLCSMPPTQDRNTIAPEAQAWSDVLITNVYVQSWYKPAPLLHPCSVEQWPYIFLIRRWQID